MKLNHDSDEKLLEEVRHHLQNMNEVDTHNFDIKVADGVVRIQGEVPGRHAKRITEECLSTIEGIKNIENQLKIRRVARFTDNSMSGF